jgi:hypothetical protein
MNCINVEHCSHCIRNLDFGDYFKAYNPTCRFGYEDCIHDPAYIFCYHKEWYHELYGDILPQDVESCECDGSNYDWEDK